MAKYLDENGLQTLWSKITNKIAALNCYDTGTSDTAGTWTVTIPGITTLTEGLTIKIRLKTSYNGTTNTLNLNGLGAKTIYFRYGNKLTSHYAKESVLALTYTTNAISSENDRTGWIIENIYDSTNTYQLRKYYTRYKTKSVLYRYMICFINKDDELIPANNVSNSTATTKALTTESFMLSKGIYYYNSTTTVAAANYTGNATLYQQLGLVDLRYSFNTGTTLTANKPVYLVVTPQTDGQIKLASTPIVQSLPTSTTNNLYIFLGTAYDNYRIELPIEHPVYVYRYGYCESLDMSHDRTIKNSPDFDYVGSWHEGQIMVASSAGSITASSVDITDITDDIIALKTDSHAHSNKSVLDSITAIDASLSSTSTNPVQNKALYTALNFKADEQLPMEITTTEGDSFRSVGDAIVGINDAMLIMASEIPNYSSATSSSLGLVKLGSDTVQSTAANSVTSTSSRTYAIQKNSNGQLVVNVPWSATSVTIPSNLVLYNNEKYAYGATGSWEFYQKDSTSNKCNIVYGTVSINKTSFYNQSITFAKSLPSSNYSVILTATISNNTASREVFTSVYSRSTTGFVCNGHMGNTSYKIVSLHYIAIYNS